MAHLGWSTLTVMRNPPVATERGKAEDRDMDRLHSSSRQVESPPMTLRRRTGETTARARHMAMGTV